MEPIIRDIRKGRREAFREVYEHHFHPLAAFGYKFVPDVAAVEDMVQEAFISFWEKRKDFAHPAAVKSFLYTSVRNKCLNHLKHLAVQRKHEASLVSELGSDAAFGRMVIEEETFARLLEEIRALPPASHEIMILALNGMKNPEIAEELGVSVNTVKTQKKIAYAKLKHKLGPHLGILILYFLWQL